MAIQLHLLHVVVCGEIRPQKAIWKNRSVVIRDKDNSLMVKLWGEKANTLEFNIGDSVKFRNVHTHHYMRQVSVASIDDTEMEVGYFHYFSFCNFAEFDYFDFQCNRQLPCVLCYLVSLSLT